MADNVDITAGSGTTVHADEYTHTTLGSGKTQLVKLVDGAINSDTAIGVDIGTKTNAIRTAPASDITDATYIGDIKFGESLPAGTNAIGKLAANSGVDIGDVDVLSVPAPLSTTGGGTEASALRVTIATDSTGVLTVDDGGGALTVDGTVTANAGTNLNTSALALESGGNLDTIAGDTTSIDGKITACNTGAVVLAAGTATYGKLAANSGVDIGDVDVTSIIPGTGASNLGKAEDAVHSSGDVGVMSLVVRSDAGGALAGTDGDYSPLQVDANGALRVTGGGGGTEYTEDVATADPIVGSAIMFERDDALTTLTPAEGDWASMRCSAEGALWVQDFNSDAILADTTAILADTASIDTNVGTIAGAVSGTEMQVDVVAALPAGDNNIGNVDIASSVALDCSAATITVDLGANNDVVCAGDVAADAVDSGNPIKVGGKAVNMDGSAPGTAVAEADRTNFISDVYGRQCVETTHPNFWDATDNQSTAQTNTSLKAAPGAGLSLYITDIIISNGATAGNVKIVEDTGGTPVDIVEVMYFAANGGAVISLKTPIKVSTNVDVGYTSASVTTHSVTVSGYIAP